MAGKHVKKIYIAVNGPNHGYSTAPIQLLLDVEEVQCVMESPVGGIAVYLKGGTTFTITGDAAQSIAAAIRREWDAINRVSEGNLEGDAI